MRATLQNCHNKETDLKQTEAQCGAHPTRSTQKAMAVDVPKRMLQSNECTGTLRTGKQGELHIAYSNQPAQQGDLAQPKARLPRRCS